MGRSRERTVDVERVVFVVVDLVFVLAAAAAAAAAAAVVVRRRRRRRSHRRTDHQRIFNFRVVGSEDEDSDVLPETLVLISRKFRQQRPAHLRDELRVAVVLPNEAKDDNVGYQCKVLGSGYVAPNRTAKHLFMLDSKEIEKIKKPGVFKPVTSLAKCMCSNSELQSIQEV